MSLTLRRADVRDASICGPICFNAFAAIADAHNFVREMPSADAATGILEHLFGHPGMYAVVAEIDGQIVGSNVVDLRDTIAAVGPITVDPAVQNKAVGRALMEAVKQEAYARGHAGVRLVQAAYHSRSFSLYVKQGFDVQEPLVCLQGPPLGLDMPGYTVRAATRADMAACNRLCERIHGFTRAGELADAVAHGSARVVERDGAISGYTSALAFFGHTVGETNEDIAALIAAAPNFGGPGFLLPSRNTALLRWCLGKGLRIEAPMTLMSHGQYSVPKGPFLPSIGY